MRLSVWNPRKTHGNIAKNEGKFRSEMDRLPWKRKLVYFHYCAVECCAYFPKALTGAWINKGIMIQILLKARRQCVYFNF